MRFSFSLLATAAALTAVEAQNGLKGMNYGAFFNNQAPKHRVDFEYEFNAAKNLPGTNGAFTSARLYTMVQWGTQNTVIEAIQAAINTKTTLLLGMWASSGQATFDNEIVALKAAIQQYGKAFTDLVVGISVGSEDLYRITPTSIKNGGGPGAQPNELIKYIRQTRDAIRGTPLAGKPVGHVDTWTAYVNGSNSAVIDALDFLGVDAYPYFQTEMDNGIENANKTFYDAFDATVAAAKGKPVWVTEAGWPVIGPTQNKAVASAENARIFWEDVSCSLMAKNVNFYYYMLQEAQYGNPSPDFGIMGPGDLGQLKPRFDLTCPGSPKPVSILLSYVMLPVLSPLFFLLLYNVSIMSRLVGAVVPARKPLSPCHCICTCITSSQPVVHPPVPARRLVDWHAWANGHVKSLSGGLPSGTASPTTTGISATLIPSSLITSTVPPTTAPSSTVASSRVAPSSRNKRAVSKFRGFMLTFS
jgi:glucan endo-1,3-beta-D-glucosidase